MQDCMRERTRYLLAGSLIDGSGAQARRNVCLAVRAGVIAAVELCAETAVEERPAVEDFSHCTLVPPLVDCSVALSRSGAISPGTARTGVRSDGDEVAVMVARHIRDCHVHGVLGVADSSNGAGRDREGDAGELVAIRRSGRDFLRIEYSPGIGDSEETSSGFGPDSLQRILRAGKGKKTVVVANGPDDVAEALAAGCDAIEQGYGMGEENLRIMAEKGILWIPSVVRAKNGLDGAASGGEVCCRFSTRYVAPGGSAPGAEAHWRKLLADQLALLQRARELGVMTAVGTGAGSPGLLHGESVAEEIKLFMRAGYTLEEALCCASENGARFFGMDGLGMLAPGRRATFLITRGSPGQLPRKLSYLEGIYVNGAPSPAYSKHPVRRGQA
ncbi:MAG: hypothetical protein Kow0089_18350 [Desulfobulbaceae bacterium]